MVFSVSGLRRGVRRCLNGRHARAGWSPRASEVGARGEPALRVDRRSTRDTLSRTTDDVLLSLTALTPIHAPAGAQPRSGRLWSTGLSSNSTRRSHRPEGGSGSDRYPSGTRPRQRAWSPPGDRARAAPGGTAHNRLSTPLGSFVGTLHPRVPMTPATLPRPRTTGQEGRSPLRQGAGELRGSRSQPAPASCDVGNGESPPAPAVQRSAAGVVPRVGARRSRAL